MSENNQMYYRVLRKHNNIGEVENIAILLVRKSPFHYSLQFNRLSDNECIEDVINAVKDSLGIDLLSINEYKEFDKINSKDIKLLESDFLVFSEEFPVTYIQGDDKFREVLDAAMIHYLGEGIQGGISQPIMEGEYFFAIIEYYDSGDRLTYPIGVFLIDETTGRTGFRSDDENKNIPRCVRNSKAISKINLVREKLINEFDSNVDSTANLIDMCKKFRVSESLPASQVGIKGIYSANNIDNLECDGFDGLLDNIYSDIVESFFESIKNAEVPREFEEDKQRIVKELDEKLNS